MKLFIRKPRGVQAALLVAITFFFGCGGDAGRSASAPHGPHPHGPTEGAAGGEGHSHHHGHEEGGDPLVHGFESAEEWAKLFDDPSRDAWQRPADVTAALRITPGMTVADLGAGTGYFEPYLSRAVGPSGVVMALDIEPDMIRYLRERAAREGLANVRPTLVSTGDPGLPAGSVDRILIVDTWHHIPNRAAYAERLKAALRPGGSIAVVDFTLDSERGPPKHHRTPPDMVIGELRAAGLSGRVIEEPLPDQYIVIGTTAP